MIRLASVCPSDPFDFFPWVTCSLLRSFGFDPDKMQKDLVSALLSGPLPQPNGNCSSLFESFVAQPCVTQTLWHMTEAAAYPLIVAVLGARFARMLTHGNYQVSPGWAIADPLLRAVVAAAFIHVSYGVLVEVHVWAQFMSLTLFRDITSAGGVTGAGLAFPAGALLLTDLIYWLYSIYIFFLFIASLIGFQICVVLAPLVIPFWIYSGQNHVFSWFTKTVLGALALPVALALGWGIVVDLVHQLAMSTQTGWAFTVIPFLGAQILLVIVIGAGVWFMGKFVKATTGELFSGHLLTTMFLAGSVLGMASRTIGAATPTGVKTWASQRTVGLHSRRLGGLMPAGLTKSAYGHLGNVMAMDEQVGQLIASNPRAKHLAAGMMGARPLGQTAMDAADGAQAHIEAGDIGGAGQYLTMLTRGGFSALAYRTYLGLPLAQRRRVSAALLSLSTGAAHPGTPRARHLVETGKTLSEAVVRPDSAFGQHVQALSLVQHLHQPGVANAAPAYEDLGTFVGGSFDRNRFHWPDLHSDAAALKPPHGPLRYRRALRRFGD